MNTDVNKWLWYAKLRAISQSLYSKRNICTPDWWEQFWFVLSLRIRRFKRRHTRAVQDCLSSREPNHYRIVRVLHWRQSDEEHLGMKHTMNELLISRTYGRDLEKRRNLVIICNNASCHSLILYDSFATPITLMQWHATPLWFQIESSGLPWVQLYQPWWRTLA